MKLVKKLSVLSLSLALISGTLVTSCKKDKVELNIPAPVVLTNTQKLTGKNFKMTAFTVSPAIPVIGSDIYSQIPACNQDDITIFNTNFTITDDEGATKCDPSDPQTTTGGTWVWNTSETVLTVTYPDSDPLSLNIITNDGTTLKGSYSEVVNGVNYTYTITWVKQ